jgi:hypothetical protein
LFNDDVEDENDARFARLATEHANSFSHDAIAQALNDYAELAQHNRAGLESLGGYDVAMIDEAKQLAKTLRERSAQVRTARSESAAALPPPKVRDDRYYSRADSESVRWLTSESTRVDTLAKRRRCHALFERGTRGAVNREDRAFVMNRGPAGSGPGGGSATPTARPHSKCNTR